MYQAVKCTAQRNTCLLTKITRCQAQSPYSASKISAEAIVYSFFRSYALKATIARPFNTYGPRQSARAIIPAIIIQIAEGKKKIEIGNVSPRRDLNYVTDTCEGLTLIAENSNLFGQTLNIGSGIDHKIGDVFRLICKQMDARVELVSDLSRIRPADAEVLHLLCDNSKIKKHTGFSPQYNFNEGLAKTIKWLLEPANIIKYKSGLYNV